MAEDSSIGVDEFEREPVPERALLGFKSFVGMYAGEHTAGTELMIGPLFVAAGAQTASAASPQVPALPAGIQQNDLLLLIVSGRPSGTAAASSPRA